MRDQRRNPAIDPFKSTKSTDNNIIERIWVEINSRVNYPLKNALEQFAADALIDMMQDYVRFDLSWVSCRVAKVGLKLFSEAWNHHTISLKGRPIDLMAQNSKAMPIDQLMSKERAAKHHIRVTTTQLTSMSMFGVNPLLEYANLQIQREPEFSRKFSFKSIFSKIQQEDILEFRFSIQIFLRVSFLLCKQNCEM